jgi:ABC-2 type transport system ATP-binding protein
MQVDEYLIETRGLRRRFGPQVAVDDLNLLVPAAGVYVFPGPSGAGKTTANQNAARTDPARCG